MNTKHQLTHHQHNIMNPRLVLSGRRSTWSGRRNTWSTFIEVRRSPATMDDFGRRLVLRGRRDASSTSDPFCLAGAALGAAQRGRRSTWTTFIEVRGSAATIDDFGRRLVLRGRPSTWSTSDSFCVAGASLGWSTFIES